MATKQDIKDIIFSLRLELLDSLNDAAGETEPILLIKKANKVIGGRMMLEKIESRIEKLSWEE